MSMFPMPDAFAPQFEDLQANWERMTRTYMGPLPREVAGAVNLMAHPMATMAAASAVGLGLASQAFGLWMGAVAGAAESSRHILMAELDQARSPGQRTAPGRPVSPESVPSKSAPSSPVPLKSAPAAEKAQRTARTVLAEAERRAGRASDITMRQAEDAAADLAEAVKAAEAIVAEPAPAAETPAALVKPAAMDKPKRPDDLKQISGIGPKLEQVLNGYGIWTYGQIAALTPPEIAWLDDHLGFAGRIARDNWIGQAATRARTGGRTKTSKG